MRLGEGGRKLFIAVKEGEIEILTKDDQYKKRLRGTARGQRLSSIDVDINGCRARKIRMIEGTVVGEFSFFLPTRRLASIRACSFCDFLVLDKEDFDRVFAPVPHYVQKMYELARDNFKMLNLIQTRVEKNFLSFSKLQKMTREPSPEVMAKWGRKHEPRHARFGGGHRNSTPASRWTPDSTVYQAWCLVIFVFINYQMYAIPFQSCFAKSFSLSLTWIAFDAGGYPCRCFLQEPAACSNSYLVTVFCVYHTDYCFKLLIILATNYCTLLLLLLYSCQIQSSV
jgi:hypothetical protein